jgi:hypothetical protein
MMTIMLPNATRRIGRLGPLPIMTQFAGMMTETEWLVGAVEIFKKFTNPKTKKKEKKKTKKYTKLKKEVGYA